MTSIARTAQRVLCMLLLTVPVAALHAADSQAAKAPAQYDDATLLQRARELHQRIVSIDTHVDIPADFGRGDYDPMKPGPRGQQLHIPTMRDGGLNAAFFIVYVGQGPRDQAGYAQALSDAFAKFASIHNVADNLYPSDIELATSAADVRRVAATGKRVALIGMENGYPMGKDLRLLDQFYDYGARYFGLVHVGHNDLADSSMSRLSAGGGEPITSEHGGLTELGRKAVTRLNELGIMVDVSHASEQSTLDVLKVAKAPVLASHSGAKGVYDHPRNLSDAELLGIAKSGGVAQMVAYDSYIRAVPPEKMEAVRAAMADLSIASPAALRALSAEQQTQWDSKMAVINAKWPGATVSDLVDHIDYAVKVAGIDHVGIASDFNGGGGITGWRDAGETMNVTVELLRRSYDDEAIEKIWGGNLLRVMDAVEAHAAGLRTSSRAAAAATTATTAAAASRGE